MENELFIFYCFWANDDNSSDILDYVFGHHGMQEIGEMCDMGVHVVYMEDTTAGRNKGTSSGLAQESTEWE